VTKVDVDTGSCKNGQKAYGQAVFSHGQASCNTLKIKYAKSRGKASKKIIWTKLFFYIFQGLSDDKLTYIHFFIYDIEPLPGSESALVGRVHIQFQQ